MKTVQLPDRCQICGGAVAPSRPYCRQCRQPCNVLAETPDLPEGSLVCVDMKSECCQTDITLGSMRTTCSDACHEALVEYYEQTFGKYKAITSVSTGRTHRVPTRTIIEVGVNHSDLWRYPIWSDE